MGLYLLDQLEQSDKMNQIPPEVFDILILAIVAVGMLLAALRVRADLRAGPRFPDATSPATPLLPTVSDKPQAVLTSGKPKNNPKGNQK